MTMKRIALFLVAFMLLAHPCWAARAKVASIAKDPYAAAILLDAETAKVLFAENADAIVYPASVIKLMNMLVILEQIDQGKVKLTDMVQVTAEAAKTGGSQVYLDPKEQFAVEELLYALAVQSANDAAVALAIHVAGSKEGFIALMNEKAAALGMKKTQIHSVHGLPPSEGQKPDETTAADLAILCRALVKRPDVLKYTGTRERSFRDNKFIMRNHNHLLSQVDGCDGLKTGYYEAAGFSIATTAKRGGVRMIAIVMGSKDRKVRDAKAAELIAKGFTMVPPKPEPAISTTITPAKTEPAKAPTQQAEQKEEAGEPAEPATTGKGWGMFFLGMAAGAILAGVPLFFLLRQPAKRKRR